MAYKYKTNSVILILPIVKYTVWTTMVINYNQILLDFERSKDCIDFT